jgi:hypothetical protein
VVASDFEHSLIVESIRDFWIVRSHLHSCLILRYMFKLFSDARVNARTCSHAGVRLHLDNPYPILSCGAWFKRSLFLTSSYPTHHTHGWSLRLDAVTVDPTHPTRPAVIPPTISEPARSQQQTQRTRAHYDSRPASPSQPCSVNAHISRHYSRDSQLRSCRWYLSR